VADALRETSLHKNPFWILAATARDDRHRIVQRAEEMSLELDHDLCQRARSALTNPRTRLAAEIGWCVGMSPKKAEQLMRHLMQEPMAVRSESGLPVLAHLNLMVAAFDTLDETVASSSAAAFIQEIAALVDGLRLDEIRRDINEDRAVSGFPEINTDEKIESELSDRKRHIWTSIKDTLNRLPTKTIVQVMTEAITGATQGGESHAPELIDELIDSYEGEALGFLQKEANCVFRLVETAREIADRDRSGVGQLIDKIDEVVHNWARVGQPIQLSAKARGITHVASNELAFKIRGLAIDLFNEHDMVAESKRLTELLRHVFAEVPQFAERVEQDADALESIIKDRQEWAHAVTYQAEVGVLFKDRLSISPSGISWKGNNYPLDEIKSVRWGGIKRSVNGIPAGTTYTLAFGNERSEAVVELRREDVYSAFLEKLWRAVCVRLITELVATLKTGGQLDFGDAEVSDECVILKKHKWFGPNEFVRCTWEEVHVWSAEGSFVIGATKDKKIYSALSYIQISNVHILEHVIRLGFKKGIERLSDIVNDN
jgi:hypothetical protein